ncbi:MAG: hypothetical protein IPK60_11800 [Sandaracinaceae bacterium]|nr:hypothetical protein [Sandaracinaceae bacterium]
MKNEEPTQSEESKKSGEPPKKAEPGASFTALVVLVFCGGPIAIGGLIYLANRWIFTDTELAAFRFANNEATGTVDAPSSEILVFRLDAECDTQMRGSEFSDELFRSRISIRVEDRGGAVQTVTCGGYDNNASVTHSSELRRRPKLDGIPLDCDVTPRFAGPVVIRASASWNGAHVRSATLHVTQ